jgi:hypothetical protein
VQVKFGLGDPYRLGEIVVRKGRVEDFMAMGLEVRWFETAWSRKPTGEGKGLSFAA